ACDAAHDRASEAGSTMRRHHYQIGTTIHLGHDDAWRRLANADVYPRLHIWIGLLEPSRDIAQVVEGFACERLLLLIEIRPWPTIFVTLHMVGRRRHTDQDQLTSRSQQLEGNRQCCFGKR